MKHLLIKAMLRGTPFKIILSLYAFLINTVQKPSYRGILSKNDLDKYNLIYHG